MTFPSNAAERALAAAVEDHERIGEFLTALGAARLWVPLPEGSGTQPDGSVTLPTLAYEGEAFVPAFTSAEQLAAGSPDVPHAVVPARELARLLPDDIGIALNPGAQASVPIYPEGVAFLAQETDTVEEAAEGVRVSIGHPEQEPTALLDAVTAVLRDIPQVGAASRAWLEIEGERAGLVVAVRLDEPADETAQEAVLRAVEGAVAHVEPPFPVDVTFTDVEEDDPIDAWMRDNTDPFYVRAASAG